MDKAMTSESAYQFVKALVELGGTFHDDVTLNEDVNGDDGENSQNNHDPAAFHGEVEDGEFDFSCFHGFNCY